MNGIDNGHPMAKMVSSDFNDVSQFNNIHHSDSSYYRLEEFGFRVINSPKAFLEKVHSIMAGTSVSPEKRCETFRNKRLSPVFQEFFFRSLNSENFLLLVLGEVKPQAHFTEEQAAQCSSVFDVDIQFRGDVKVFSKICNLILDETAEWFSPRKEGTYKVNIQEMYATQQGFEENSHNMSTDDFSHIKLSLYPGIDMEMFLDAYHKSDENMCIFVGPPGTGKTSLLKLLLRETAIRNQDSVRAIYVKDPAVLHSPMFWSNLSGNRSLDYLILDDLDNELTPRSDVETGDSQSGQKKAEESYEQLKVRAAHKQLTIVNQLLSFTDGLFQNKTKVLITSNLENTSIDSALLRPGRCFDILRFPKLDADHALRVWRQDYGLSQESFEDCFEEVKGKEGPVISQALLVSEAEEIIRQSRKGAYLTDKSISVRNKYM